MRPRWYFHPLLIFIFSLLALGASLFLYIHWYLKVDDAFRGFLQRYNQVPEQFFEVETWAIILVLSLLVATILVGMLLIYLFYQKTHELYRMQQNFINGLTHELKTPIASLQLYLETLHRHQLPRDQELKILSHMAADVRRLGTNAERILNMARLEERKLRAERRPCDLGALVGDFLRDNAHLFEGVELSNKIPLGKHQLMLSPELFELLLANLVQNAITHNSSAKKQVTLDCRQEGDRVLFWVEDNGTGIPQKERSKVFRKYYQVGKGVKGSGIGLFLASQIVRLHQGRIRALESDLGPGTRMQVTLPAH